jgi:hypothetical protein
MPRVAVDASRGVRLSYLGFRGRRRSDPEAKAYRSEVQSPANAQEDGPEPKPRFAAPISVL